MGYKRVTMDMFSAGESLGRGSGGVKGRGERPGRGAGRGFNLAWGFFGSNGQSQTDVTRVPSVLVVVKPMWVLEVVRWVGSTRRRANKAFRW